MTLHPIEDGRGESEPGSLEGEPVKLSRPPPEATLNLPAETGQTYLVEFDSSLVRVVAQGDDLVFLFKEGGGRIVLQGLADAVHETTFVLAEGAISAVELFELAMLTAEDPQTLETLVEKILKGGGNSSYSDEFGIPIVLLDAQDGILGRELEFELALNLEPAEDIQPTAVNVQVDDPGIFVEDTPPNPDNSLNYSASAGPRDELIEIRIDGLMDWNVGDGELGRLAETGGVSDATFGEGTLTIRFDSGLNVFKNFIELIPPKDSDIDLVGATITATARNSAGQRATSTSPIPTLIVDAVADGPEGGEGDDGDGVNLSLTIGVVDDGNDTLQTGETGRITFTATFDDFRDGSETHQVTVAAPVGFVFGDAVGGLPAGVTDAGSTLTMLVLNVDSLDGDGQDGVGSFTAIFEVTNVDAADGSATFTATATATENPRDEEPNRDNNTAVTSTTLTISVGDDRLPTAADDFDMVVEGGPIDPSSAVDIYLLQDLSRSFGNDVANVQLAMADLVNQILGGEFPSDTQLGAGSFVDKPLSPFGVLGEYTFLNGIDLTTDYDAFLAAVDDFLVLDGRDFPEGQLEGLLEMAGNAEALGFRPEAQKFVILTTDASFHQAGDADLPPEDGVADGDPANEDYPSVQQVADALEAAGIVPVFLVTSSQLTTYQTLVDDMGIGVVVELTSDSSNLLEAVLEGIGQAGGDNVTRGNVLTGEDPDDPEGASFSDMLAPDDDGGAPPLTVIAAEQDGAPITIGVAFPTALDGTLTLNADGSYTYEAPPSADHSEGEVVEVFTYTIENGDGQTDSATLSILIKDAEPIADADTNSVTAGMVAYGDIVDGGVAAAGSSHDTIDLADLLDTATDFTGTTLAEAQADGYVQLLQNGGTTEVRIDPDGGGDGFTTLVATLNSVTATDLDDNIVVD